MTKFRAFIGRIWGKTTTLMLAVSGFAASALAVPAVHDLLVVFPWFPYLTAGVGLLGFLGRIWAPPPPSVSIPEGASATVLDAHTIAIQTPSPLPADAVQAASDKPDVPGVPSPGLGPF